MPRWWLLALVAPVCGCASSSGERVVATLSSSAEAGSSFAELRNAYEHDPHTPLLVGLFESFIRRFPHDQTTPLVRLYLGHLLLDTRDLPGARQALAAVPEPPAGNAHDFWVALRARIALRDGKADDALALLQPLVGKVVDVPLRVVLLEEVAVASIEAHRPLEAVAYLDGWLRVVPPHAHKDAHDRVSLQLDRIDPTVLAQTLEAMQGEGAGGYSPELQRMVAESLTKHALDTQDTRLAQRIIDSSLAKYVTATTEGQDLRDLATSLRGEKAVVSRTIGLVLPTDTPELRDAAADAARGAAYGLGLPRAQNDTDGTRLVTRAEASQSLEASLEELAGAGASVVLAGIDADAAERACRWSEENGLPVITLSSPAFVPGTHFCFDAGEARQTSLGLLVAEIAKRAHGRQKVALVAGASAEADEKGLKSTSLDLLAPFRCEPPFSRTRLPLTDWQGVRYFVMSAPSGCVRTVLSELLSGSTAGLALESPAGELRYLRSGVHVIDVEPVASAHTEEYEQKFGAKPTWWAAVGRDAALLAHSAQEKLPSDRATSMAEIARRRELVRESLAKAQAALWTTSASGFEGGHKLARSLRVADLR